MDPVKIICDELKVSREEALYYLEGFNWELNPAIEACRTKTLPPIRAKSSYAPPQSPQTPPQSPHTPPSTQPQVLNKSHRIHPLIQSYPQIPREIQPITKISPAKEPSTSRDQLIASFCDFTGAETEKAVATLDYFGWDVNAAAGRYLDGFVVPPPSSTNLNISLDDIPPLTGLVDTKIDWPDLYKSFESLTSSRSIDDGTIPVDILSKASSQEQVSGLNNEQLIQSFLKVNGGEDRGEAMTYLSICNWDLQQAIDLAITGGLSKDIAAASKLHSKASPRSMGAYPTKTEKPLKEAAAEHISVDIPQIASLQERTSPANSREETLSAQSSQLNDEKLIRSFLKASLGATREEAIACLKVSNWELHQAVEFYNDDGLSALDMSMALLDSQYQDYSEQSETGNPTSLTETETSPEDVTVAIPGMSSPPVDGKAVEEDSYRSTTLGPKTAQTTTITLTIVLADRGSGTEVELPFRSDQTVRDIREAIEERTSNNDRNYFLQSRFGDEYTDLTTTVMRLNTAGSTTLIQIFRDT